MSITFLLLGCDSDESSGTTRPAGRGSAACQAWQKALCDHAVECGLAPEASCVETYYSVTCNSDANAESCATAFESATCTTALPAGCNIDDLADPAPAVDACSAMLSAYCDKGIACGQTTVETCLPMMQKSLDCTTAIGYTSNYEGCMSDIAKLDCSASSPPDSCDGVIQITQ